MKTERAVYPHCDPRILHAPGVCEFCDHYPDFQELRKAWSINFTGQKDSKKVACPADAIRGDGHKQWSGNQAVKKEVPPVDRTQRTLTDGSPETPDHREINPETGMQKAYVVLSAEERAKGLVRPVRAKYIHVGRPAPKYELLDLTDEQKERYADTGFVKFEEYPESESPSTGRFWTQKELDSVDKGCRVVTRMSSSIAETYARDPRFYGSTFCVGCGTHLPVGEQGEFIWDDGSEERVGT